MRFIRHYLSSTWSISCVANNGRDGWRSFLEYNSSIIASNDNSAGRWAPGGTCCVACNTFTSLVTSTPVIYIEEVDDTIGHHKELMLQSR